MEKILLYIEPVALNDDPDYHNYWIDLILGNFSTRTDLELILVSSAFVCAKRGAEFAHAHTLNVSDLVADFGYDKVNYVNAICGLTAQGNGYLEQALRDIKKHHQPDYVLSWTENDVLKSVFAEKCLFLEMGPLPRYLFKPSAYVDPFGQHRRSVLQTYENRQAPFEATRDFRDRFQKKWVEHMDGWGVHIGMHQWLDSLRDGRSLVLLALQPRNDFGYLGCNFRLDEASLVRQTARRSPETELVIPLWHPASPHPSDALIEELCADNPNLRIPPADRRYGTSEMTLNAVDEVVTVSSNVAFAAALLGKKTTVLGDCKFSAIAENTRPGSPRIDLLAFVMNGYALTVEGWKQDPQGFLSHLRALQEDPYILFNQPQAADETLFDSYFSL